MHAVVVDVEITDQEAAGGGSSSSSPAVRQAPGFVAAYWVRLGDGTGTSIAVYDTEEQARAVRRRHPAAPPVSR